MSQLNETIIIAVGGSLLVPDAIDIPFIQELKKITLNLIKQGYQVILVPGGGKTARNYQHALQELGNSHSDDLDNIGIKAIDLNCDLLMRILSAADISATLIYQPEDIAQVTTPVIIKAAFAAGNSSDVGAIRMAAIVGAQRVINFSNTSHVYSADPRVYSDARKYEVLSWDQYLELIPAEWTPGMSAPFDPVASKMAKEHQVSVAVLGASIHNLQNYLEGKGFEGTIIS